MFDGRPLCKIRVYCANAKAPTLFYRRRPFGSARIRYGLPGTVHVVNSRRCDARRHRPRRLLDTPKPSPTPAFARALRSDDHFYRSSDSRCPVRLPIAGVGGKLSRSFSWSRVHARVPRVPVQVRTCPSASAGEFSRQTFVCMCGLHLAMRYPPTRLAVPGQAIPRTDSPAPLLCVFACRAPPQTLYGHRARRDRADRPPSILPPPCMPLLRWPAPPVTTSADLLRKLLVRDGRPSPVILGCARRVLISVFTRSLAAQRPPYAPCPPIWSPHAFSASGTTGSFEASEEGTANHPSKIAPMSGRQPLCLIVHVALCPTDLQSVQVARAF